MVGLNISEVGQNGAGKGSYACEAGLNAGEVRLFVCERERFPIKAEPYTGEAGLNAGEVGLYVCEVRLKAPAKEKPHF